MVSIYCYFYGAGNGSRTHLSTLGRSHSTDEIYPRILLYYYNKQIIKNQVLFRIFLLGMEKFHPLFQFFPSLSKVLLKNSKGITKKESDKTDTSCSKDSGTVLNKAPPRYMIQSWIQAIKERIKRKGRLPKMPWKMRNLSLLVCMELKSPMKMNKAKNPVRKCGSLGDASNRPRRTRPPR